MHSPPGLVRQKSEENRLHAKEFFKNLSTAGDIAAAAIGYAVGFAVDAHFFPGGISPGVAAGVSSVGALGLKKFADVLISARRQRKNNSLDTRALQIEIYLKKALDRSSLPNDEEQLLVAILREVRRRRDLWAAGLLDDEQFEYDLGRFRRGVVLYASGEDDSLPKLVRGSETGATLVKKQ